MQHIYIIGLNWVSLILEDRLQKLGYKCHNITPEQLLTADTALITIPGLQTNNSVVVNTQDALHTFNSPVICNETANHQEVLRLNTLEPVNFATICEELGLPFIYLSTSHVFDCDDEYVTELITPNNGIGAPASGIYAQTKRLTEQLLSQINYGTVLRVSDMFGNVKQSNDALYRIFHTRTLTNKLRSFTYVPDIATAIDALLKKSADLYHYDIFNISSGNATNKLITGWMKHIKNDWLFIDKELTEIRGGCLFDCSKIKSYGVEFAPLETSISLVCGQL